MPQTTDGWLISTVEQDGKYAGEALGKVGLKSPKPRTNSWTWYAMDTVEDAETAAEVASTMTKAAFDTWYDQR